MQGCPHFYHPFIDGIFRIFHEINHLAIGMFVSDFPMEKKKKNIQRRSPNQFTIVLLLEPGVDRDGGKIALHLRGSLAWHSRVIL